VLGLSFERDHQVLRLDFAGLFTAECLEAVDRHLLAFLSGRDTSDTIGVRVLYDLRKVTALAVPSSRFAARAQLPAVGGVERIVVKPRHSTPDFGHSYREQEGRLAHRQPIIVPSLKVAYSVLHLGDPCFDPVLR